MNIVSDSSKDEFHFKIEQFSFISVPFIIGLIISVFFSMFGIFIILLLFYLSYEIVIILIYTNKFSIISRYSLILCIRLERILKLIPGVNLGGNWYIEHKSYDKSFKSIGDLKDFLTKNWNLYVIIHPAIFAFELQLWFLINGSNATLNLSTGSILFAAGNAFAYSLILIPLFSLLYFSIIFVWEDAGIKIQEKTNDEITKLDLLSNSAKNFFNLFIGFSTLIFLANEDKLHFGTSGGITGAVVELLVYFAISSGATMLLSIIYYKSKAHQNAVNKIRDFIMDQNINDRTYRIKIYDEKGNLLDQQKLKQEANLKEQNTTNNVTNRICPYCGYKLENFEAKFCHSCGKELLN